jgi:hypothetical protein
MKTASMYARVFKYHRCVQNGIDKQRQRRSMGIKEYVYMDTS